MIILIMGIIIFISIFSLLGVYKVFGKAGEKGWKAVIPFYNTYIMYKITGTSIKLFKGILFTKLLIIVYPIITFLIAFILLALNLNDTILEQIEDLLSIIILIILCINIFIIMFEKIMLRINLAKKFNKSTAFTIGLIYCYFIFIYVLAFNKDEYMKLNKCDEDINENINEEINDSNINNGDSFIYEYTLDDLNLYKIYGESTYVYTKRKKYMNNNKFTHIGNYNIKIILIIIVFCIYIFFTKSPIMILGLSTIIAIYLTKFFKTVNQCKGKKYLEISSDGLIITTNYIKFCLTWDNINIIAISKNIITIIPQKANIIFLIKPNEDVIKKLKEYSRNKIIEKK